MNELFERPYPRININAVPGFRYRGGKFKLRRPICRWLDFSGTVFVDVFAGRGNMMFIMKSFADFKDWHLNDIQTIPFFESILDYDGSPIEWPTEQEFREMAARGDTSKLYMEPALMWDGATLNAVGGKKVTFAGKYKDYNPKLYRKLVLRAQRLLYGVELTATDAVTVIREYQDDPDSMLYIDPPYLSANVDAYDDKMVNRKAMIEAMKDCRCKWLLSEYYCDDLVKAFGEPVGKIRKVQIIVPGKKNGQTSTKGTKKVRMETECLWANYPAKPKPLDFGYRNKPLQLSLRILKQYEKLSLKQWCDLAPSTWDFYRKEIEFIRMTKFPLCYFDGISVEYL